MLDKRFVIGVDIDELEQKKNPINDDLLIIADSQKKFESKKITISSLPGSIQPIPLGKPELVNPDDSPLFTSISENETKTCKIKDYDNTNTYNISANSGTIGPLDLTNGTFAYTAPDITGSDNITDVISIYYVSSSGETSQTNKYNITVVVVSDTADGLISDTAFLQHKESSTNMTTGNSELIAQADNATFTEKPVSQDSGDTDWTKASNTKLIYRLPQYDVVSSSSNTLLVTTSDVSPNTNGVLIDNSNNIIRGKYGNVSERGIIYDIFGDKSAVAMYRFENNVNDEGGLHNGAFSGTEQYTTGVFGKALLKDNTSEETSIRVNQIEFINQSFSISVFAKFLDGTGYNGLFLGSHYYTDEQSFIWVRLDQGNFTIRDEDGASYIINYTFNVNQWYHIVVVADKTQNKTILYVNGSKAGDITGYPASYLINELLGSFNTQYRNGFHAAVDQIRIFNRAITADEVLVLNKECISVDINAFNMTMTPKDAFLDSNIYVYLDIAPDTSSLDINSATALSIKSTSFDGTNFTNIYNDYNGTGRVIQRKIEAEKQGVEIFTPFTTEMYKQQ